MRAGTDRLDSAGLGSSIEGRRFGLGCAAGRGQPPQDEATCAVFWRVFGTPLLPGSSTLPGYYGTSHSYSYDGPYYGGPSYGPYWNRLPYACGVYGYC